MNAWTRYWRSFGIPYGLLQAAMATCIVVGFLGMVLGIAWMWWQATP
ncbi:hypothetical protein [Streptomyces olivaceiscleroticus]|uniref:Uncharacterized protein n=1 Tax=Streptomyces olivaceiscleroticus TaxID=68245 RepID=A0ABP3LIX0_9ACTN